MNGEFVHINNISTFCLHVWVFPVEKLASECMVFECHNVNRIYCLQVWQKLVHIKPFVVWVLPFWTWTGAQKNFLLCWYSDTKWKIPFILFLMPDLKIEVMPALSAFNCSSFIHEWIFYPLHHYWNMWTYKYIVCGMGEWSHWSVELIFLVVSCSHHL